MKLLLASSLLFMLLFGHALAQDFIPIRESEEAFFKPPTGGLGTQGIKVYSITIDDADLVFSINQSLNVDEYNCEGSALNSWLGRSFRTNSAGDFRYITYDYDTVHIRYKAMVGESWEFIRFPDGIFIEATVSEIVRDFSFLNLQDDVKVITLQLKSATGQALESSINDETLMLSREHGMLGALRFYKRDASLYKLVGLQSSESGAYRYSRRSVYDFQVGNEFHYRSETRDVKVELGINSRPVYFEIWVLTKKEWLQADKVRYTWKTKTISEYNFEAENVNRIQVDSMVIQEFDQLNSAIVDLMPYEYPGPPVQSPDTFDFKVRFSPFRGIPTLPIAAWESDFVRSIGPDAKGCFTKAPSFISTGLSRVTQNTAYAKGLGQVYYNYHIDHSLHNWHTRIKELLYFKKGPAKEEHPFGQSLLRNQATLNSSFPIPAPGSFSCRKVYLQLYMFTARMENFFFLCPNRLERSLISQINLLVYTWLNLCI